MENKKEQETEIKTETPTVLNFNFDENKNEETPITEIKEVSEVIAPKEEHITKKASVKIGAAKKVDNAIEVSTSTKEEEDQNIKFYITEKDDKEDNVFKKRTREGASNAVIIEEAKKADSKVEAKVEVKKEDDIMTPADLAEIATVVVGIFDMITVSLFRWYAGDTLDSPYDIKSGKKELIISQLTRLFIKYNTKLSLELLLLVTVIAAYAPSFNTARNNKKIIKGNGGGNIAKRSISGVTQEPIKSTPQPTKKTETPASDFKEDLTKKEVVEPVKKSPPVPVLRKPGGQPKN